MIGLEDRQALARDIDVAHAAGARLRPACEIAGIDLRSLQRWRAHEGLTAGDGRPQAERPMPSHALSQDERAQLLAVANEPRFAAMPPARIVPMLADEGIYLASESSFSRVLRAQGQTAHRGRAKAPKAVRPPTTHIAAAPREVWCWDMTYLPAQVLGRWLASTPPYPSETAPATRNRDQHLSRRGAIHLAGSPGHAVSTSGRSRTPTRSASTSQCPDQHARELGNPASTLPLNASDSTRRRYCR
jgi:hypothetical protein